MNHYSLSLFEAIQCCIFLSKLTSSFIFVFWISIISFGVWSVADQFVWIWECLKVHTSRLIQIDKEFGGCPLNCCIYSVELVIGWSYQSSWRLISNIKNFNFRFWLWRYLSFGDPASVRISLLKHKGPPSLRVKSTTLIILTQVRASTSPIMWRLIQSLCLNLVQSSSHCTLKVVLVSLWRICLVLVVFWIGRINNERWGGKKGHTMIWTFTGYFQKQVTPFSPTWFNLLDSKGNWQNKTFVLFFIQTGRWTNLNRFSSRKF